MKKLFFIICLLASVVLLARDIPKKLPDSRIGKDFYATLAKIYGRVAVVQCMPDFSVRIVDTNPDLSVQVKGRDASHEGEWEFVGSQSYADFTIQFVDCDEDFTIQFVDSCPGPRYRY